MDTGAHQHDLRPFTHEHQFGMPGAAARSAALWQVAWITLVAMGLELSVGYWSGSLALTADGWHMGTHAFALGGAAFAMLLSRRAAHSRRFAFGGWKIEMLAAYSSALLLLAVALSLVLQAVDALRAPREVAYVEAMAVALIGLIVNLLCAWLLSRSTGPAHAHADTHAHEHGHAHAHHDHNFHAAWLHVVADALTSVLALLALAGGLWWGWRWLDPAVSLVGALVIARWGFAVAAEAARALADASGDTALSAQVREALESDGDAKLADLHVWQVGPQAFAAAASLVADAPLPTQTYRARLAGLTTLRHVTLEVHRCTRARSD
jgi:cation diffusion facilitator family transporter